MRKKIIAGNWKMNTTIEDGLILIKNLDNILNKNASKTDNVIVFPPFTHLSSINSLLNNSWIELGAQNMSSSDNGAYTGEISADMLINTGCKYVIIGHSERRQYFNENNELLNTKVKQAIKNELTPIYCCGETLNQREAEKHFYIIEKQINEGLFNLSKEDFQKIIIAYEPVWAIGTGKTASPEQAEEIHQFIRQLILDKYTSEIAINTSILYGGSVKASNANELFLKENIDGGLIGGASLKSEEFNAIINAMS